VVAFLSRRVGDSGHVYSIDHSEAMLRQAARRNAAAIRAGRVTLTRGSVDELPPARHGPFDAILAVNSSGFWTAPTERLDVSGAASTSRLHVSASRTEQPHPAPLEDANCRRSPVDAGHVHTHM
jgi:SAM-dependent methyltransferase